MPNFHLFRLQFYVLENSLELYARDMLLLSVLLEPPEKMGLQGEGGHSLTHSLTHTHTLTHSLTHSLTH